MNLGGHLGAVLIATSVDVLMAAAFYLPMATGSLFVVPIASMAVGAYAAGVLAMNGAPLVVILPGGILAGAAMAFLGGAIVMRMKGWSAAVASLAIVVVVQVFLQNFTPLGAALGLIGIPLFTPLLLTYVMTLAVIAGLLVLELGRFGDVVEAIRGDDLAAECSGIRVKRVRLAVFVTSGAIAGLAGSIAAGFLGFVDPATFGFVQLNNLLVATILGGSTTAAGSLFGGIVIHLIPEILTFAERYMLILFSFALVVLMLVRPQGAITRRLLKRLIKRVTHRAPQSRPPVSGDLPSYLSGRPRYTRLIVSGLTKSFGGNAVVRGVDVELRAGQVLGVIGANGAGKTTLVNLITGVVRPDRGQIRVSDEDQEMTARHPTPGSAISMGIARTFQHSRLYPGMTAREHVALIAGVDAAELLELVGLEDKADEVAMSLPYGDQRLVGIARALATQPRFLILDEPAAGMTSEEASAVADLIRRLSRERGLAVLVIDHNVQFISAVSDAMVAMDFGSVIASGSSTDVLRSPKVISAYLGEPI